jgi:hypothetical protein
MVVFSIGKEYQGGIIFHVDESGAHGLIASTHDLSGEADWNEAVEEAAAYQGGGFADWRLPDEVELNLLYLAKDQVGKMVRFSYWSATEYATHFAWFQHFGSGERENDFKDNTCYIRAIRSF